MINNVGKCVSLLQFSCEVFHFVIYLLAKYIIYCLMSHLKWV